MAGAKKIFPTEKPGLHLRNIHRARYDFVTLTEKCPALIPFVKINAYQDPSIDFFDPVAVRVLNQALLKTYYAIDYWQLPPDYLCPPIPGRVDYIHHLADIISHTETQSKVPVKCLDIGVGASCIYPILGVTVYGWSFVGSDIDPKALESAQRILASNPGLKDKVELRLQPNPQNIFKGIIREGENFDLTICNPPFHASQAAAQSGALRKIKNLKNKNTRQPVLNFGGQHNELWYEGGEEKFVTTMIRESKQYASSCKWFTSLISKQETLKNIYLALKKVEAVEVKTIKMQHGNKSSRIVAWTFGEAKTVQK